ncbi:MAG TPA: exosortase/archaeosortase family protein [Gemmataceae bacterium]|nr:exosortase/archaeosortase family protein [Gemmataceae bacterium]
MLKDLVARLHSLPTRVWVILSILIVGVCWTYWPALGIIVNKWDAAQYSHGWLVPFFSLFLLWQRRALLDAVEWKPNWWGLVFIALAVVLRLTDGFYYIRWFDTLSLLPCLAGLCLLLGGWSALRWAWPAIAFLFFMLPLPYSVETAWAYRLRLAATATSTFFLQTLGFPAIADGTDIILENNVLQIAPACSGMGMLFIFLALSTAIVIVIKRPWLDKLIILLSAIPIAILANIVRITMTALLFRLADYLDTPWLNQKAHSFFHDGAGYLMMLVALALLLGELWILDRLFIPVEEKPTVSFDFARGRNLRRSSPSQKT